MSRRDGDGQAPGRFAVTGEGIEPDHLVAEIEARAGQDVHAPPAPAVPEEPPPDPFSQLLRALAEDADAAEGFPPQSHRALGSAVVAAKKGFRLAFQPLLRDALARQTAFNRRLLDALAALRADQQALSERLAKLERPPRRARQKK